MLAWLFTGFMVVDRDLQLRPGDLPPAAAAGAQRARLVGVARSGVPRQQLDSAVLGVLHPVRDDVPDAQRSGDRAADHGRAPFFNKWMVPIGLVLLFLTGVGPLLGLAQVHAEQPSRSFLWPVGGGRRDGWARSCPRRPSVVRRVCASRCARFVAGTVAQEFWRGGNVRRKNTGTDLFTAIIGLVGRNKRRYGGYIVHLGIVLIFLGLRRERRQRRTSWSRLQAGRAGHRRRVHRPQRRRQGDRRRPEADGHGDDRRVQRRQADRHDVSGPVGLPEARGRRAADRRRNPAVAGGGPVSRAAARHRLRHADDHAAGGGQSARGLDLARLRRNRVRHRHRAAAGAHVLVCAGQAAG